MAAQVEFLSSAPPIEDREEDVDLGIQPGTLETASGASPEGGEIGGGSGVIPPEEATGSRDILEPPVWKARFSRLGAWLAELGSRSKSAASAPENSKEAGDPLSESNVQDFNPLPPERSETALSSREIFGEVGALLAARREMLSLTFEEIERHTRVRAAFVRALEAGALDELPSPVQTRGILANYAGFLDLDVDAVLLRFADGLQARYRERRPLRPKRTRSVMTVNTSLPPWRSFIASDLLFGGGMAILLILFAIWGINRVVTLTSATQPQATAPSISDVLAGTPLATLSQDVTLIPAQNSVPLASTPDTGTPFAAAPLGPNVNVQIELLAVESTYLRVSADGKLQFEGRVVPGLTYPYIAQNQIDVLVGNAAAIKVTYNGRDLGLMGGFGEVVDRVYTVSGVVTATSTQPPTATATPFITLTPSQTPTRGPTLTPTPTSGG
jgi:cytoskeletal protein RodZ